MGETKFETDLSKFKIAEGQRPASPRRVKEIAKGIKLKNMLDAFPLVGRQQEDGTITVYDGQHRLEAAKIAQVDGVWWIDATHIEMGDIARANSAQRPWRLGDYLKSWSEQGEDDYTTLSKLVDDYSCNISVIINAMLPALEGRRITDDFKAGIWSCDKLDELEQWLFEAHELDEHGLKLRLQGQMSAWLHLRKHPDYSHKNMLSRLELYPRKAFVRGSMHEMVMDILKIYNYKLIKNGINADYFTDLL